jgi:hypothetical protein
MSILLHFCSLQQLLGRSYLWSHSYAPPRYKQMLVVLRDTECLLIQEVLDLITTSELII